MNPADTVNLPSDRALLQLMRQMLRLRMKGSIKKTPGNYMLLVTLMPKLAQIERGGSKQSALKGLKKEI